MPLSNCSYLLHSAKTADGILEAELSVEGGKHLKVVRWQRNDETLGTATAARQRLPGHPPPARTALCASVCIDTHILKLIKIIRSPSNRQATGVKQNGVNQNTRQYLPQIHVKSRIISLIYQASKCLK